MGSRDTCLGSGHALYSGVVDFWVSTLVLIHVTLHLPGMGDFAEARHGGLFCDVIAFYLLIFSFLVTLASLLCVRVRTLALAKLYTQGMKSR